MSVSRFQPRRGSVLLGVLVLVTIGAFVGTSVLVAVDARQMGSSSSLREDQARALVWSGVQAVMAELSSQREDLLAGLRPELTEEWVLFTDELGREGVVRLLALDGDGALLAQAEAGKLDINHASEAMLARLEGVGEELASRIVAAREASPFASVEELLRVEGVTPALLYGEVALEGSGVEEPEEAGGSMADAYAGGGTRLVDVLTVFSFDPNVQGAIDDDRFRGQLRVNFDLPWSDDLARAVEDRFGEDAVPVVRRLFEQGVSFATDADLCRVVQRFAPDDYAVWAMALDALTTSDDAFRPGRVDLNAAGAVVLSTVPGFDREIAEQIVLMREDLDDEERQLVVWPLMHGIVTPEQFMEAVDHLTTRSLQYRVRIEAGWRRAVEGEEFASMSNLPREDRLEHRRVVDAVIDVASTHPRVAYLRDVTLLGVARAIARESEEVLASLSPGEAFEEVGPWADPGEEERGFAFEESGAGDPLIPAGDGMSVEDESGGGLVEPMRFVARGSMTDFGEPMDMDPDRPESGRGEGGEVRSEGGLIMVDRRIGRWTNRRASR